VSTLSPEHPESLSETANDLILTRIIDRTSFDANCETPGAARRTSAVVADRSHGINLSSLNATIPP
jgi:hypothetical protein